MSEKLQLVPQVARHGSLAGRRNNEKSAVHFSWVEDMSGVCLALKSALAQYQAMNAVYGMTDEQRISMLELFATICDASSVTAAGQIPSILDDGFRAFRDRADTHSSLLH